MSRILEFQHSEEHNIVARVLLDLHQRLDQDFPSTAVTSRQFSKTVLTTQTALPDPKALQTPASSQQKQGPDKSSPEYRHPEGGPGKDNTSIHEKPQFQSEVSHLTKTVFEESRLSKFFTWVLAASFVSGSILFVWFYLFSDS